MPIISVFSRAGYSFLTTLEFCSRRIFLFYIKYMKNKKLKTLIPIFLILILVISIFFILKNKSKVKEINTAESPLSNLPLTKVEKEINGPILEIDNKKYQSKIKEEISIADFMEKLKREGKINYKDKNYVGMGKFIEEINGIKNSGEENWIYYVNGKKANIGVSNYKIRSGDIVSWKYEKNY